MHITTKQVADPVLEYTWEQAPVFVACFDDHGLLRQASRYATELIEASGGQAFAEVFVDFSGTQDMDSLATDAGPHLMDVAQADAAPITLVCHVQRVADGYLVCGAIDAEEVRRMERQILALNRELSNTTRALHKSNAELAVLNRLKNQFLGMAAHDLRKPAGVIETYVGFVLDEAGDRLESEHLDFLKTIRDMGRDMSRLIDDFLDVSMIESGKLELHLQQARIGDVLERARRLVAPNAQRAGVTLDVDVTGEMPLFSMDCGKMEQVFANLLSNAVEYSPGGGRVRVHARSAAGSIEVSVCDQGPGITDEQKRTLFNAFARGKTPKAGSRRSIGLGLMIAKKIVESHGGQIGRAHV
mgnify:FL=1